MERQPNAWAIALGAIVVVSGACASRSLPAEKDRVETPPIGAWASSFSGDSGRSRLGSVTVSDAGITFAHGSFVGTCELGGQQIHQDPGQCVFAGVTAAFDPEGELLWKAVIESKGMVGPADIIATGPNRVIVAGSYSRGPISFDEGETWLDSLNPNVSSAYLAEYRDGRLSWARTYPHADPTELALAEDGSIYFAGSLWKHVQLGAPKTGCPPGPFCTNPVLAKLDPSGEVLWSLGFACKRKDTFASVNDVSVAANGEVVLGGSFKGALELEPGTVTSTGSFSRGFVMRVAATGDPRWVRSFGTSGTRVSAVNAAGPETLIGGRIDSFGSQGERSLSGLDCKQTTTLNGDNYLVALDASGACEWLTEPPFDEAGFLSLARSEDGGIYLGLSNFGGGLGLTNPDPAINVVLYSPEGALLAKQSVGEAGTAVTDLFATKDRLIVGGSLEGFVREEGGGMRPVGHGFVTTVNLDLSPR